MNYPADEAKVWPGVFSCSRKKENTTNLPCLMNFSSPMLTKMYTLYLGLQFPYVQLAIEF